MKSREYRIIIANLYIPSGGTLVLSALCAELRKLGYDASVLVGNYSFIGKHFSTARLLMGKVKDSLLLFLNKLSLLPRRIVDGMPAHTKMLGCKYKLTPFFNKNNTIVIYPEVIYGNPLGARNVVRWLLYFNRYAEETGSYEPTDRFMAYREVFNDSILNPNNYLVTINHFDKDLYRQYNFEERSGNCYILRKGKNRKDLPKEFDGPVFDNDMTDKEFVEILNRSKYCYSYDTQTFYTKIASVCGCISVIVPEEGKGREDYLDPGEDNPGIAYGDSEEEIRYAMETRPQLLANLDFDEDNELNAGALVKMLEKEFGKIKRIK